MIENDELNGFLKDLLELVQEVLKAELQLLLAIRWPFVRVIVLVCLAARRSTTRRTWRSSSRWCSSNGTWTATDASHATSCAWYSSSRRASRSKTTEPWAATELRSQLTLALATCAHVFIHTAARYDFFVQLAQWRIIQTKPNLIKSHTLSSALEWPSSNRMANSRPHFCWLLSSKIIIHILV